MKRKIFALAALAVFVSPVAADGIPIEPGLWSVTSTVNMPMMPQPQTLSLIHISEPTRQLTQSRMASSA